MPLAVALSDTNALLFLSAGCSRVRNVDLERAAMIDSGWVFACVAGLCRPQTRESAALVAQTAALDGGTAVAQWLCRPDDDVVKFRCNA